jgi:exonuclease VII large subunit
MDTDDILDVDLLLERVAAVSNCGYWIDKNPYEQVRGKVYSVSKSHYGKVYVTLAGDKGKITLVCPESSAPAIGQYLVCKGVVEQKFSEFSGGIEVHIKGSPVGEWKLKTVDSKSAIKLEKSTYKPFTNFLDEFEIGELLLLGSKTGIDDVKSQIKNHQSDALSYQINVSDSTKILDGLKSVVSSGLNAKGVAIVRGGDDESLEQWDDPAVVDAFIALNVPIYAAIGHSHKVTLLDKYADQSFSTPTSLGLAVGSALQQKSKLMALENDIDRSNTELDKEKVGRALAEKQAELTEKKNRALMSENARYRRATDSNKKESATSRDADHTTVIAAKAFFAGIIVSAIAIIVLKLTW